LVKRGRDKNGMFYECTAWTFEHVRLGGKLKEKQYSIKIMIVREQVV
jgi:hypothetical protein